MGNPDATRTLLTGSLATRRRTVAGILGQSGLAGLDDAEVRTILRLSGLPVRAASDPDFPVSVDRELTALSFMLDRVAQTQRTFAEFAIETFSAIGINHYGVLGLAMQHAPTALDAVRVMLAYPELCWGHSRIVVTEHAGILHLVFEMDAPTPDGVNAEDLREYCVTTDLVSVEHLISDVIDGAIAPLAIALPFRDPGVHFRAGNWLVCPVTFGAPAAEIRYPAELAAATPVHAGDLPFRRYEKIARAFSSLLAEEEDIAEQCSRLLWAYTPPPSRQQLADMLGVSTRTLARRLRRAGTSYAELLKRVQTERAKNYLRHTATPIAEIAEHMGYSDPAAFTRAFQGWTGVTPSHWRTAEKPEMPNGA
ncbi:MAG: helix-turn-helix domain-containing protein [Pseudomonadales bacterium]